MFVNIWLHIADANSQQCQILDTKYWLSVQKQVLVQGLSTEKRGVNHQKAILYSHDMKPTTIYSKIKPLNRSTDHLNSQSWGTLPSTWSYWNWAFDIIDFNRSPIKLIIIQRYFYQYTYTCIFNIHWTPTSMESWDNTRYWHW